MLMTKAYAKINLGINVINKDEKDSYHNLDMVVVPIELHDRIEIEVLPFGFDTLITSDDKELPTDETNIVYKVEKALQEKCHYKEKLRIHIHKIIPVGAGLGGGSADGAAVLIGINKLLKLKLTLDELCEIGLKVGSDIPFCLKNISSRVQGKGNILTPLKQKKHYEVLILFPKKGLSTKDVYINYDKVGTSITADIEGIISSLEKDNLNLLKQSMANQLEDSASSLFPGLLDIKKEMFSEGLDNVVMSGSGSSLFSISSDKKLMKKVYNSLTSKGYNVVLTKTK
ncbi:MAG: 4-(cytidine 5'-diphospho)-2-C-methyl-D-erythritol kinase [Bacilli bacterium]|nr:4-(cytidine 5'-diphospho)-2-C-methyl-D-erythritol kinase [Bacillales bacterium]MDY2574892.1 4-(cytidine 5'-diphospho)-2-C-methyl-D-erythritol kinase [Bacilli bacterium]